MTTIEILQLIGSFYILLSFALILNTKTYYKIFNELLKSKSVALFWWIAAYVIWFLILLNYNNFWFSKEWLIAVIWIISLIKWIILILFPKIYTLFIKPLIKKKTLKLFWFLVLMIWLWIMYLSLK